MKKKVLAVFAAAVMTVGLLASCGGNGGTDDGTTAQAGSAASGETGETVKIGVIQQAEHPALDSAYEGFLDALKEAGYEDGVNMELDYNNAQGDTSNCETIATKLVNDQSDLILAIATPAAQAVAGKTTEIPILATAVTDFEVAGLVDSNDAPGPMYPVLLI